jgi:glycosyltransferase involved in cell wall biosynthesis
MQREIHELGIASGRVSVELLGWRDAEVLRLLYANADGFVLASKREAFGIAALEARAAGLPVIAMAASGSREFLHDDVDALLCRDDADLIACIARFIGDADLRSRLANAPVDLMRYDWTAVLDAHERAYERAVTRGRDV